MTLSCIDPGSRRVAMILRRPQYLTIAALCAIAMIGSLAIWMVRPTYFRGLGIPTATGLPRHIEWTSAGDLLVICQASQHSPIEIVAIPVRSKGPITRKRADSPHSRITAAAVVHPDVLLVGLLDGRVLCISLGECRVLKEMEAHSGFVMALSESLDDRLILTGGVGTGDYDYPGDIRCLNPKTGEVIPISETFPAIPDSLAMSTRKSMLYMLTTGQIAAWNIEPNVDRIHARLSVSNVQWRLQDDRVGYVGNLSLSPSEEKIVAGGGRVVGPSAFLVVDANTGEIIKGFECGASSRACSKWASEDSFVAATESRVELISVADGKRQVLFDGPVIPETIAVSRCRTMCAIGHRDGVVVLAVDKK